MNINDYLSLIPNLENFHQEQIEELFDFDNIESFELSELFEDKKLATELLNQAAEALGYWLMGNTQDAFEILEPMNPYRRERTLWIWLDTIKDPDTLRRIGKTIFDKYHPSAAN